MGVETVSTQADNGQLSEIAALIAERAQQRQDELRRRRQQRVEQRAAFAAARMAGLRKRHAVKG